MGIKDEGLQGVYHDSGGEHTRAQVRVGAEVRQELHMVRHQDHRHETCGPITHTQQ